MYHTLQNKWWNVFIEVYLLRFTFYLPKRREHIKSEIIFFEIDVGQGDFTLCLVPQTALKFDGDLILFSSNLYLRYRYNIMHKTRQLYCRCMSSLLWRYIMPWNCTKRVSTVLLLRRKAIREMESWAEIVMNSYCRQMKSWLRDTNYTYA